jgi:glycosyltransferase involved in cell wall biosynthesis
MKVCVSGLRGFPGVMGGIETHCQNLYPRLAAEDPDLDIVVFARTPYAGRTDYVHGGVRVSPVWTVRSKLLETILHTFLCVLRARFVERADVLHLHAIGPGLMTPLARLLGMRVVATHHGEDYRRMKWGPLARAALRTGEFVMTRFAARTICVGRSGAARLQARFPARAGRIRFIPNGAALPDASPGGEAVLQELGLSAGRYILAVGRLVPEKGFQDLAAARKRARTDMPLVVVGGADHEDAFSAALRAEASPEVRFAGVRRGGQLAALFRGAGLFVLPSHHEGHPIVALEALRSGAPVLLSDIEANRDIGLDPEHYFPTGDVDALAAALSREDFSALRVRDDALLDAYDWARVAADTAETLREAAA